MILSQHLRLTSFRLFLASVVILAFSFAGFPSDSSGGNTQADEAGGVEDSVPSHPVASDTGFRFEKEDRIVLIGNVLAERMQHDGWMETAIQSRLPGYNLVFRNLGFSADEIKTRFRSAGFGSPDEHLTSHKADVVFAFFGYNESFAGSKGLENFHKELTEFIKHAKSQKYNGKSAPKLVLFSPIAHEDIGNPNLPNGKANNVRLELYTNAMAKIARENKVTFVDLFHPTLAVYKNPRRI